MHTHTYMYIHNVMLGWCTKGLPQVLLRSWRWFRLEGRFHYRERGNWHYECYILQLQRYVLLVHGHYYKWIGYVPRYIDDSAINPHTHMHTRAHINNSYQPVIGMHEMHGRMHPNYWQITILLVVDLCSSLAYFMMTHPLPIAGKLPIKTLVTKQLPTNTHVHVYTQYTLMIKEPCQCLSNT